MYAIIRARRGGVFAPFGSASRPCVVARLLWRASGVGHSINKLRVAAGRRYNIAYKITVNSQCKIPRRAAWRSVNRNPLNYAFNDVVIHMAPTVPHNHVKRKI